jgi:FtsZ-binding cell division protein ZapB
LIKQEALATLCFQLLELEQEKGKEEHELLETQHNRLQFAELKREVAFLRDENRNLQYVLFCN